MAGYFTGQFVQPAAPTTPTFAAAGAVPYGTEAANINQFMTGQALQPFVANLPGYAGMVGQRSQNTASMLKGQLPNDVIANIAQSAAERGITGGAPMGPNANAAYLRSLGLSSLDLMGKGSEELSKSIADTPVPELFNPGAMWQATVLGQQEQAAAQAARQFEAQRQQEAQQRQTNEDTYRSWQAWNSAPNWFDRPSNVG